MTPEDKARQQIDAMLAASGLEAAMEQFATIAEDLKK